jgi:hypothetical protein
VGGVRPGDTRFVTEADLDVFRPLAWASFGGIPQLAGLRTETDTTDKPYPILHLEV